MSVSFNKPHDVDVPVHDLDDPEDDVLFGDSTGRRNSHGFLDSLDYSQHATPEPRGIFSKFRALLTRGPRDASYELMDGHDDVEFFNVEDDYENDNDNENSDNGHEMGSAGPDLRKFQIKRLERKLNKTIVAFACGLVFVFSFLFFTKDSFQGESPLQKIVLSNSTHNFHPTTLMISLDGFHPHYISAERTPALHNMLVNGYGAPYMEPSFPSSTFPNHWTLVTGLYPADHGIVGNTFYDPQLQKQFINTNPDYGLDPQFWQGGEPLWTTAAKHGVRSAIHMWPGSEVPGVGDNGPMKIDKYNGTEPLTAKVDRVFGWLDVEEISERPELILAYVSTIDQFGHKYGISGDELVGALKRVDDFVQLTLDKLAERKLEKIVNVIIVSDHGMAPTSNDRLLFLDDVVDTQKIEHIDGWPLFGLRPKNDHSIDEIHAEIKAKLEAASAEIQENFRLYRVEEFPAEWNFGGPESAHRFNYRLAPLWLVPNVGYSITTRASFAENNNDYYPKGVHGYNNTELLMRAIFLGEGPYFEAKLAKNKKVVPFSNVNVYNIVCDTLQIPPSANNGTYMGKAFSISSENRLPKDWTDHLVYPNLPYEVDHLVRNATYDQLWRPSYKASASEVEPAVSSIVVSSVPDPEPSLPKPSDFLEPTSSATTTQSTQTSKTGGFFGNLLGGVGDIIDEFDESVENVIEDALEYADSWIGGNSDTDEDI